MQKEAMERRREAEQEVSILERARRDAKIEEEKKRTAKLVSTVSWLVVHSHMTSKLYRALEWQLVSLRFIKQKQFL